MKLFVDYVNHVTDSNSGEESWYEHWDFDVIGVHTDKKGLKYPEEITVDFDVETGDRVYVLSIIYSDGDSFGNAEGKGEVVWVFKDFKIAKDAKDALEKANTADKNDVKLKFFSFKTESGVAVQMANPCAGYFENMSWIDINEFIVNK